MSRYILIFIFICLFSPAAFATTIHATSCGYADVSGALSTAVSGDTVQMPACPNDGDSNNNYTGTQGLSVPDGVTLSGDSCTLNPATGRPTSATTVLFDNRDFITPSNNLIVMSPATSPGPRITCFEIRNKAAGGGSGFQVIGIYGPSNDTTPRFRIDHMILTNLHGWIYLSRIYGVIDHSTITISPALTMAASYCTTDANDLAWTYNRWAEATDFGSEKFIFWENNTFNRAGTIYAATDGDTGCRAVFRFNDYTNLWIEAHGTDSAGLKRGTRAIEAYGNTFDGGGATIDTIGVNSRSGSNMVWHNSITNTVNNPAILTLNSERELGYFSTGFMASDGVNPWDVNGGNPDAIYTVSSVTASGASGTITISGAGWTPNQYTGFVVVQTAGGCSYNSTCSASVTGNTTDTLSWSSFRSDLAPIFAMGDTIHLNIVRHAIDDSCRVQGSLLSVQISSSQTTSGTTATVIVPSTAGWSNGDYVTLAYASPGNYNGIHQITVVDGTSFTFTIAMGTGTSTFAHVVHIPAAWNDQTTEGCYQFLNTVNGSPASTTGRWYVKNYIENEDYFNYGGTLQSNATTPFDGTKQANNSVGVGTLARMPTTCTVGVFYWAYDDNAVAWNSSGVPIINVSGMNYFNGAGYKCTSTNTWTKVYTPYTYPHPLAAGSAPTLSDVTPSSGTQGASVPVTLTGTGFDGGNASVTVSGLGVTASGCSVVSSVSITCTFIIAGNAATTARDVAVHTDQGDSGNQTFTVFTQIPGTAPAAVRGVFR